MTEEVKIESTYLMDRKPLSNGTEIEKLITEEELKQLTEFKNILEKDFPEEIKNSNNLWRFLKARKMNFKDAEEMFRNYIKWFVLSSH
jgi:transposase